MMYFDFKESKVLIELHWSSTLNETYPQPKSSEMAKKTTSKGISILFSELQNSTFYFLKNISSLRI